MNQEKKGKKDIFKSRNVSYLRKQIRPFERAKLVFGQWVTMNVKRNDRIKEEW